MSLRHALHKLTSTANASFHQNSQTSFMGTSPEGQSQSEPSLSDKIFTSHGITHDFIRRATAFGVLKNDIKIITPVHITAFQYAEGVSNTIVHREQEFDCAILELNLSPDAIDGNDVPKLLRVYKDKETGLYTIGEMVDGVLMANPKIINKDIDVDAKEGPADKLEDHQLCLEIFKWARDAAEDNRELRVPLMNTMDHKKSLPGYSLPARVGRAFVIELTNYIHRTFC